MNKLNVTLQEKKEILQKNLKERLDYEPVLILSVIIWLYTSNTSMYMIKLFENN